MSEGRADPKRRANVTEEIQFQQVIPILRIFDVPKAEAFYLGLLGFIVDWDHRFDANEPLYRQVSRSGFILNLSEHHVTARRVRGSE